MQKITKEKRFGAAPQAAGILALALVFVLVLAGCELTLTDPEKNGYTIRFKVGNATRTNQTNIEKVEFINGDHVYDNVRQSYSARILFGTISGEIRVSGFTLEDTPNTRKFGVKITFADESYEFASGEAGHGNKILVDVSPHVKTSYRDEKNVDITFSPGNW